MRHRYGWVMAVVAVLALFAGTRCNRAIVYGTEQETAGLSKVFKGTHGQVFEAARRALTDNGYKIQEEKSEAGILETGWVPAKAASHYVDLFGRRDYATVGAYYKLHVAVSPEEGGERVEVRGVAKTTISNLKSSGSEEKKILKTIADMLRSASIEITNVGMTEK